MLFLNLIDLFKIVLDALKYQLLLILYVLVKKKSKIFHLILCFKEKQLFFAVKTVSFFIGSSQVKMNIRILFYSLLRSPVQKSGMGPFFFYFFENFASGNPGRRRELSRLERMHVIAKRFFLDACLLDEITHHSLVYLVRCGLGKLHASYLTKGSSGD